MGRGWSEADPRAAEVFAEADALLGDALGAPLSTICFDGPAERLNRTDVSQPAIYTCSVACHRALVGSGDAPPLRATAGLSLGEYTALHLAGVFDFAAGLRLVALRGRLMQQAAESSRGGMMALIGADEAQAGAVCERSAAEGGVLVAANFNAPGQIVLSGSEDACGRAEAVADEMGLRAKLLVVAGAFHSPLMQPAADAMAEALEAEPFQKPNMEVWCNVTAAPHPADDVELLKRRLVEQIVSPVKWAQICQGLPRGDRIEFIELAPGSVLRGLMRRIDKQTRVTSHDQPTHPTESATLDS
jgi:[acyl-carrier-protein] S-malonyltransferase